MCAVKSLQNCQNHRCQHFHHCVVRCKSCLIVTNLILPRSFPFVKILLNLSHLIIVVIFFLLEMTVSFVDQNLQNCLILKSC